MAILKSGSKRDSFLPTGDTERIFSATSYILLWWSSLKPIQLFILGQSYLPPHGSLNIAQAITAILATGLIVTLAFSLNGTMGQREGVAYAIQLRSSFGVKGAKIPAAIRAVPAIVWYGIGSWIGAMAVAGITQPVFGYGNVFVYFVLFQIFQTAVAYFGIQTIKWFESLMALVIFAIMGWMCAKLFGVYGVNMEQSWRFEGSWGLPFLFALNTSVGILSTEMISISDLTRYLHRGTSNNWLGHAIGVNPPFVAMVVFGILAASSVGIWNPIEALMKLSPSLGMSIVLLVFVTMAQVTTNLTLNILPPALALMDLTGISWARAVILVGVASIATFPWLLLESQNFQMFIIVYSAFLGPILGIMLADYWLIHKRRPNIEGLYNVQGNSPYWFFSGFNWVALVTLAIGGTVSFIFLKYSWFVGVSIGFCLYFLLMKLLHPKSSPVEVSNLARR